MHGGLGIRNDFADDRVNQEPERALVTEMGHSQGGNVPAGLSTEGEQRFLNDSSLTTTMVTSKPPEQAHFVALRTVPVVVKNRGLRLVLKVLANDTRTKTYINGDAASELGLKGTVKKITIQRISYEMVKGIPSRQYLWI